MPGQVKETCQALSVSQLGPPVGEPPAASLARRRGPGDAGDCPAQQRLPEALDWSQAHAAAGGLGYPPTCCPWREGAHGRSSVPLLASPRFHSLPLPDPSWLLRLLPPPQALAGQVPFFPAQPHGGSRDHSEEGEGCTLLDYGNSFAPVAAVTHLLQDLIGKIVVGA